MDNKDLNEIIVKRIQYLRHQRKMSQDQLSELSDLPIKYINRIENFKTGFTIATLDKIIHALDVSYQQFFEFESELKFSDVEPTFQKNKLLKLTQHLSETIKDLEKTLKE